MKNYEATKYRVKWAKGSGYYYPDACFLDVVREVGAPLTPEEGFKINAMCAKHHRRVVAADRRGLLYAIVSIVVAATIVTLISKL